MSIAIGDVAPDFGLPSAAGGSEPLRPVAVGDPPAASVVYWTCNHCPYALVWDERIQQLAADYADRGVRVLAINSNNAVTHPHDSFDQMVERVAAGGWTHPYLHDESQQVAREWGARTTPDMFILDRAGTLRYRGAPDADYEKPELKAAWARQAIDAVLAGTTPDPEETEPVGCGVKWK